MEQIMDALTMLVTTIITGVISLVGAYVTIYFKNLIDKVKADTKNIKNEQKRALVNNALDRLNQVIYNTVYSTQVTLVDGIKAGSKDGKLTADECKEIKQTVISQVKHQVSDELQSLVQSQISDVDAYIANKIETELARIKNEQPVELLG